jgi:hypothetical protein
MWGRATVNGAATFGAQWLFAERLPVACEQLRPRRSTDVVEAIRSGYVGVLANVLK